ncbi:MAG: MarC family protein, partial [Angustibacter sp.]
MEVIAGLIDWRVASSVFVTLLVIMDPPGTVPIFIALTQPLESGQRIRAARQAVFVALGVIVTFAVFGRALLGYLHISRPALQCAGGLLLLLVALELLTGKDARLPDSGGSDAGVNVALVPLGTPLLAGPGAIVATMVFVQQAEGRASHWGAIGLGVGAVHFCLWLAMRFAGGVHRLLGDGGTTLVSRISGLLLSAIAVQLV